MTPDPTAIARLALTLFAIFSVSVLFWIPLRAGGRTMWAAAFLAALLLMAAPLLIPAENIGLRALAAVLCIDQVCKLFDAARRSGDVKTSHNTFHRYLKFLIPCPPLLVTGEERRAMRPVLTPLSIAAARAAIGTTIFTASWFVLQFFANSETLRTHFALDHLIKITLFPIAITAISIGMQGWERLAGFETSSPMNYVWRSRTPAEFWLRYNTRIQIWFARNLFLPAGGQRHPVRGVVLVFLVSAVVHEIMFDVATSQVDGSQLAFFLLQIPAVLLSPRLDRLARSGGLVAKVIAHAVTITWLVVTSPLFFRGVDRVFSSFYAS